MKERGYVRRELSEFEASNGIHFADKGLLRMAFIHSSFVNETGEAGIVDNERLEFLGDAILSSVVSELLYARFPAAREGELTGMRSALVRKETLARYARHLHLGEYLWLGHGEDESGGRRRAATLCATFEAVVAAIYLDQGVEAVKRFVAPLLEVDLGQVHRAAVRKDAKSRLQEWAQSNLGMSPKYRILEANGPDHDKTFTSQVQIGEVRYGVGRGRSKQEASQAAAVMALARLGLDAPDQAIDADLAAQYGLDGHLATGDNQPAHGP